MNALKKLSLVAALLASVLAGCGGGSSAISTPFLGGTAAVGFAIVGGAVDVKCASSAAVPSTTTSSAGALQVDLTGKTLPCAIEVTGGTINGIANSIAYHSIAMAAGNVNVTPLTDLLIANLAASTTPSAWYAALTPATLAAITATQVSAATTNVKTALGLTTQLSGLDPITTPFTPTRNNVMDNTLEALQAAIVNNGNSHATLLGLAGASAGAAFTPPSGFNTALNTAYSSTSSGSTSGGGSSGTPAIASFTPTSAATAATVTITGTNLTGVTQVLFTGPSPSTAYTAGVIAAQTATSITTTVPASLAAGNYTVSVVYTGGEAAATNTLAVTASTGGGSTSTANVPTGFIARTNPSGALTMAPSAVVWTGSLFVALEPNQNYHSTTATLFSWTSTDGISWIRNTTNLPNNLGALTAANGKAFMMNSLSSTTPTVAIYSSTDGVTWSAATGSTANNGTSAVSIPLGVKYLNNKYFAAMDVDACDAIVSSDGSAWTTTQLNNLALPTGYQKAVNNKYCSEAFYVGGRYVIDGGIIVAYSGTTSTYKGLSYTSIDGATWTVNAYSLPSTINSVLQGGRGNTALQVGSNLVLPAVRTEASVRLQPTDPYPTQVISNYQAGVSSDGLTYTFTSRATPNFGSTFPNLNLPNGIVVYTNAYSTIVNSATVAVPALYQYTTDGYTFTTAQDLMFKNPLLAAYSPTLKRLVVIRQDSNATTYVNTGVVIGTLDFP